MVMIKSMKKSKSKRTKALITTPAVASPFRLYDFKPRMLYIKPGIAAN